MSWASYFEGGVAASLTKTVNTDGSYRIIAVYGDNFTELVGQYEDVFVPSCVNSEDHQASLIPADPLRWGYTYWGYVDYSVSITTLNTCSTITDIASVLAECCSLGTISLALSIASNIFDELATFYSQYGSNVVYFRANKYFGTENSGTYTIYHHRVFTYYYSDSAHNNYVGFARDDYDALDFYF